MSGYYGTEHQQKLQQKCEAMLPWLMDTPGGFNAVRLVSTDDPERFGWDTVLKFLREDGAISFRMVPRPTMEAAREMLAAQGFRLDFWDVLMGTRQEAMPAVEAVLAAGLPPGFVRVPVAEAGPIEKLQEFIAASGIVPFPASMLAGQPGRAATTVIADPQGEIAATAHCYFGHNRFSPYHHTAWGGLVAVAPGHRGTGLGRYVNARMVMDCFEELRAEAVYELVASSNVASRKMVEASGLRLRPDLFSGVAVAENSDRFSR
jgi:RimJ/RimL family protein N-acetyltransferase